MIIKGKIRIKIYSNQLIFKYNEIYHLNDEPVLGSSSQTSPFRIALRLIRLMILHEN